MWNYAKSVLKFGAAEQEGANLHTPCHSTQETEPTLDELDAWFDTSPEATNTLVTPQTPDSHSMGKRNQRSKKAPRTPETEESSDDEGDVGKKYDSESSEEEEPPKGRNGSARSRGAGSRTKGKSIRNDIEDEVLSERESRLSAITEHTAALERSNAVLERENEGLRRELELEKAKGRNSAVRDKEILDAKVKGYEKQMKGVIRRSILRITKYVKPEHCLFSEEEGTVSHMVLSGIQFSVGDDEAYKKKIWEEELGPRFVRKFGQERNRIAQKLKKAYNGEYACSIVIFVHLISLLL